MKTFLKSNYDTEGKQIVKIKDDCLFGPNNTRYQIIYFANNEVFMQMFHQPMWDGDDAIVISTILPENPEDLVYQTVGNRDYFVQHAHTLFEAELITEEELKILDKHYEEDNVRKLHEVRTEILALQEQEAELSLKVGVKK
jgi:hypothetical protein